MDDLTAALWRLHIAGYWIEAWYPLSEGSFECRIAAGVRRNQVTEFAWAVDPNPLTALLGAMTNAGIAP